MVIVCMPQILWHSKGDSKADRVYSVDFQPLHNRLASCGADEFIHIWKISFSLQREMENIQEQGAKLSRDIVDEDPSSLNTVDSCRICCISRLVGHETEISCVRFSPCGRFLASGSIDGSVCLWELSSKPTTVPFGYDHSVLSFEEWWARLDTYRASSSVMCLCWSPCGGMIAIGGEDGRVNIWNARSDGRNRIRQVDGGHSNMVNGISWDPLGLYLCTQGTDQTVRLWTCKQSGKAWKQQFALKYNSKVDDKKDERSLLIDESIRCSEKPDEIRRPPKNNVLFCSEATLLSFYRRPDWSPDGHLLVTPAGQLTKFFSNGDGYTPCVLYASFVFHRRLLNQGCPIVSMISRYGIPTVVRFNPVTFLPYPDENRFSDHAIVSGNSCFKNEKMSKKEKFFRDSLYESLSTNASWIYKRQVDYGSLVRLPSYCSEVIRRCKESSRSLRKKKILSQKLESAFKMEDSISKSPSNAPKIKRPVASSNEQRQVYSKEPLSKDKVFDIAICLSSQNSNYAKTTSLFLENNNTLIDHDNINKTSSVKIVNSVQYQNLSCESSQKKIVDESLNSFASVDIPVGSLLKTVDFPSVSGLIRDRKEQLRSPDIYWISPPCMTCETVSLNTQSDTLDCSVKKDPSSFDQSTNISCSVLPNREISQLHSQENTENQSFSLSVSDNQTVDPSAIETTEQTNDHLDCKAKMFEDPTVENFALDSNVLSSSSNISQIKRIRRQTVKQFSSKGLLLKRRRKRKSKCKKKNSDLTKRKSFLPAPDDGLTTCCEKVAPRFIWATGTTTGSILIYDTQCMEGPIVVLKNMHVSPITDITWSDDGYTLSACSSDGYVTFAVFNYEELGISLLPARYFSSRNNVIPEPKHIREILATASDGYTSGIELSPLKYHLDHTTKSQSMPIKIGLLDSIQQNVVANKHTQNIDKTIICTPVAAEKNLKRPRKVVPLVVSNTSI